MTVINTLLLPDMVPDFGRVIHYHMNTPRHDGLFIPLIYNAAQLLPVHDRDTRTGQEIIRTHIHAEEVRTLFTTDPVAGTVRTMNINGKCSYARELYSEHGNEIGLPGVET